MLSDKLLEVQEVFFHCHKNDKRNTVQKAAIHSQISKQVAVQNLCTITPTIHDNRLNTLVCQPMDHGGPCGPSTRRIQRVDWFPLLGQQGQPMSLICECKLLDLSQEVPKRPLGCEKAQKCVLFGVQGLFCHIFPALQELQHFSVCRAVCLGEQRSKNPEGCSNCQWTCGALVRMKQELRSKYRACRCVRSCRQRGQERCTCLRADSTATKVVTPTARISAFRVLQDTMSQPRKSTEERPWRAWSPGQREKADAKVVLQVPCTLAHLKIHKAPHRQQKAANIAAGAFGPAAELGLFVDQLNNSGSTGISHPTAIGGQHLLHSVPIGGLTTVGLEGGGKIGSCSCEQDHLLDDTATI
mmetsp:Transcript_118039/g.329004  ORF Transcript_118039/g.329004 Transcript_118039/m.329004 type:complete len:356 (+) Transcript_118039:878-1945(+)